MSRYDQFGGHSGSLRVFGSDTPEGAQLFAAVSPRILSWLAQQRLNVADKEIGYYRKVLNDPKFEADWRWNNKQEILRITLRPEFPVPEEKPTKAPVVTVFEKIQIENQLPPIPPQFIKTFVILFDDDSFVVYDMRSFEKNFVNQKPLIGPSRSQGSWEMPSHVQVGRLRDYYFGAMNFARYAQSIADFPVPKTLQMTNSLEMGPVAIASVSFSGGVFSNAGTLQLYRFKKQGLKSTNSLSQFSQVGDVGAAGGFPALMATDTNVYACSQLFQLDADGKDLEEVGDDIWTEVSTYDIVGDYNLPVPIKLSPNYIDSGLTAHFDVGSFGGVEIVPSLGSAIYSNGSSGPDTPFSGTYSISHGTGDEYTLTDHTDIPVFSQVGGIDRIDTVNITWTQHITDAPDYDATTTFQSFSAVWPDTPSDLIAPYIGVAILPYPPSGQAAAYYAPRDTGSGDRMLTTMFGQTVAFDPGPGYSEAWPCFYETFTPIMQVSNGKYNLQGFIIHNTTYDGYTWPLQTWYFYLDGVDFTSRIAALCETTANKIQYAFMDVPLFSAQTIKVAHTP